MEISDKAKAEARDLNYRNGRKVNLDKVPFKDQIIDGACWQWALNGGRYMAGNDDRSPETFYRDIFTWSGLPEVSLPTGINQENALKYPEAMEYLVTIGENLQKACDGDNQAQLGVRNALMSACIIISSREQLKPAAGNPKIYLYKIHMMVPYDGYEWYRRGLHWGVSIAANNDGTGDRCYIQTVTGKDLKTACDRMWDEHFLRCDISITGLSENHVIALGD